MLFNSSVFLFAFLPLTLLVFYVLGGMGRLRLALASVLIASFFFYAWWNPVYVVLIIASLLINYYIGNVIQHRLSNGTPAKPVLIAGIGVNFAVLCYFKYANFFVDNLNAVSGSAVSLAPIVLPLAISFYTFTQVAYLVDVYQGKVKESDLLRYALFVMFFPHLLAGPIVHHSELMPQFAGKSVGIFKLSNLITGSTIFFIGLFKKVVLADRVAPIAGDMFAASSSGSPLTFVDAWTGVLAYTCQIYFDFSGYSDMAIGISLMFGIALPLNFNSPYKATGIIDFWRRWHMTLSRFLRDYLYIPLGGNRLGSSRRYVNMMIVMLLGGLWHGAGWGFVVWGVLHGTYLGVNHAWRSWFGAPRDDWWARGLSRALTFLAVVIAWVFFRATSLDSALTVLSSMGGLAGSLPASLADLTAQIDREAVATITALLFIAFFAPNTQQFMRDFMDIEGAPRYRYDAATASIAWLRWRPHPVFAVALAVLSAYTVMSLWQPSEFIYYQF